MFIDRGAIIDGLNSTVRDSRIPHNVPRNIENYALDFKRLRRRKGFQPYSSSIKGVCLSKHTPSVVMLESEDGRNPFTIAEAAKKTSFFRTPLSYGLLRWHDDFQPKTTRSWTVEFLFTTGELEELVRQTFGRYSKDQYGTGGEAYNILLRSQVGVFVYDQTVLSNYHTFYNQTVTSPTSSIQPGVSPASGAPDVFGLTALAVSYNALGLTVHSTLYDNGNSRYDDFLATLGFTWGGSYRDYEAGKTYHVAIVYDSSQAAGDDDFFLYIDGELADSTEIPANHYFAGEMDAINGLTTSIQRDIVLLNEHTARGSYGSTCKTWSNYGSGSWSSGHQAYSYQELVDADAAGVPPPWCCSPPRGTCLAELRIWHDARTATELANYAYRRFEGDPIANNLVGYWHLDDGGPVCFDSVNYRNITLQSTYPGIVADTSLLTERGVLLADGQYISYSYNVGDEFYIEDSHRVLQTIFTDKQNANFTIEHRFKPDNDFTIQIDIRTPYTFQQKLNNKSGDTELGPAAGAAAYALSYGDFSTVLKNAAGGSPIYNQAYESTLFSIEAQGINESENNYGERARFPVVRALLTPSGTIVFETYQRHGASDARLYRVETAALDPDTHYNLTFIRKVTYVKGTVAGETISVPSGFSLLVYKNGFDPLGPFASLNVTDASSSTLSAFHGGIRDVIIGASGVNDGFDRSIQAPQDDATIRRYPVTQRFKSPYQDQPGFFTLGYFRMWSVALDPQQVSSSAAGNIIANEELLFDVDARKVTGNYFKGESKFSTIFTGNFKGWGVPEIDIDSAATRSYKAGYIQEDSLGYSRLQADFRDAIVSCEGLGFYSETLTNKYGIVSVFGSSLYDDPYVEGNIRDLYPGLLSTFVPGNDWTFVTIGDKTFVLSESGVPKVMSGGSVTNAGFGPWHAGPLNLTATGSGSLQQDKWYGVRIAYYSETTGHYQVSPQYVIYTGAFTRIEINDISPHPDLRVSSILIACTQAQESASLAQSVDVYLQPAPLLNRYRKRAEISFVGSGIILDTSITEFPLGHTGAAHEGRLYVASLLVPDAIFPSDAGNPERFDTLTNRLVLEESSGDAITRIVSMFGSLYVFKPNSVHKVDEVASGVWQQRQISSVGALTSSVEKITIPETGRVALAFWSAQGPYLFDEVNFQYIGAPIEDDPSYEWLDPTSVFILHDIERRELVFVYKKKSGQLISDRHDEALVYNYRTDSWTRQTGVVGSKAISLNISKEFTQSGSGQSQLSKSSVGDYQAFIAKDRIYRWRGSDYDGYSSVGPFSVSSYSAGVVYIDHEFEEQNLLRYLWVTIVDDSYPRWFSIPVKYSAENYVELDLTYSDVDFTPEAGHRIYLGFVPAKIEFPWDMIDRPFYNKIVHRLLLWHEGTVLFRYATGWRDNYTRYINVEPNSRLSKIPLSGTASEVIKLDVVSFDTNSKIDSYAYDVEFLKDSNVSP